ncbi:MAG TPA: type II toxin-antitoxin system RelE/ParE family toxin [Bryobacteraceae bacterium]|jgi:plasmid stabilization system protein ParE
MAFSVETTGQAKQDLLDILEWLIEERAGDNGLRWFLKLEEAIASLSEMPHRCPFAPENKEFPFEVRQLLLAGSATAIECCSPLTETK